MTTRWQKIKEVAEDYFDGVLEFTEEAGDPAAPAANGVVLYAKDNGAGKTALYARFATGAVQEVAVQP
jgi:hypothetical protein